ncbi:MAG: CooT family nickel-binding protein [Desulfobacteraceae bacterium]|nr:CooT family nickel-binding protein [Desulfobacteraceae bacterium]
MCQMKVLLEQDGRQEMIAENVTFLEATPEGMRVSTLFEEPRLVKGALRSIDFLAGKVTLAATGEASHG